MIEVRLAAPRTPERWKDRQRRHVERDQYLRMYACADTIPIERQHNKRGLRCTFSNGHVRVTSKERTIEQKIC